MEDINSIIIHVDDEEKNLYISRTENIKSEALSPCCMTIDDVVFNFKTAVKGDALPSSSFTLISAIPSTPAT